MTNEVSIDPLSQPAGEVAEPTFPLLKPDKQYEMVIRGSEEVEFTSDAGKVSQCWDLKLCTTKNEISTEDQTIYEGATVFVRIFLTPNEYSTADQIGKLAAMPVKAALGAKTTTTARQCINDPSLIVGKIVNVKIGIKKDKKGNYPDQNVVKTWIVPV